MTAQVKDFAYLINTIGIGKIISPIIYLIMTLALVYFLWGVLGIFNDKDREVAKTRILYGIIGLFVMSAVWGLVTLVENTLNLDNRPVNTGGSSTGGSGIISDQFRNDGTIFPPDSGGGFNPDQPTNLNF